MGGDGKTSALRAYSRWATFNILENSPTIFYDKFFTKSYLPFRTRNATALVLGIFVFYKMMARCPCTLIGR
jgi:hypothetical protein